MGQLRYGSGRTKSVDGRTDNAKTISLPTLSGDKKYVCLPNLKFSDPLPETHLFSFGLTDVLFGR